MYKVLVAEDDAVINQVITEFLINANYQVTSCQDGQEALTLFNQQDFDIVILDIMMPIYTGLEVLEKIRESSSVPIIMLTALDDEATQLYSFNLQISDFVTKPFSPLILLKRIENIIMRENKTEGYILIGPVKIDLKYLTVYCNGEELSLTRKEYQIIAELAKNKGRLVSRENLMFNIWGYDELDSRVLDNHIKNIRKKVPELNVQTVVGYGYRIVEAK